MKKRIAILPLDGFSSHSEIEKKLDSIFKISGVEDIISHIKLNDVMYNRDGCHTLDCVRFWLLDNGLDDIKIFDDMKLSDTSGTNLNIIKHHFINNEFFPNILTINAGCSSTTFKKMHELLPGVKLAIVSVLTDMTEDECKMRFGVKPVTKIAKDIAAIETIAPKILGAFVCSPFEVKKLKSEFPHLTSIVPGIRDEWMEAGQQKRPTGVLWALQQGADLVVMGAQITKGNPEKGISAEESVKMTIAEIEKFKG